MRPGNFSRGLTVWSTLPGRREVGLLDHQPHAYRMFMHIPSAGTLQSASQPAATSQGAGVSRSELKDQIKQQILDATDAAREAAQEAAQAQRDARNTIQTGILVPPTPPSYDANNVIPRQAVDISYAFFLMCAVMVVGWPLARAFGKRIERKSETAVANPAMSDQLRRIEQAVDAMSVEVERISESQRFMARLQSEAMPERASLPSDRR